MQTELAVAGAESDAVGFGPISFHLDAFPCTMQIAR